MSFLLDLNVVSEIRRGRDLNVQAWAGAVSDGDPQLSVLTLGEIRKGIARLRARNIRQAQTFATWLAELEQTVCPTYPARQHARRAGVGTFECAHASTHR